MGLFGWRLTRAKKGMAENFTQEGRDLGVEVRRMNYEERQLDHKIRMAEKERDLYDLLAEVKEARQGFEGEGGLEEELFNKLILGVLGGGGPSDAGGYASVPPFSPPPIPEESALTDAAIEDILDKLPGKVVAIGKGMSDDTLKSVVRTRLGVSESDAERLVARFRAKNL